MKRTTLFTITISLMFFSCTKDELKDEIIGIWRNIERFEGYGNGGDFQWHLVPEQFQENYQFDTNRDFFEFNPNGETRCTGTFQILSANEVEINSSCYIGPITWDISIDKDIMLVTHHVIEGIIIEKFQREE